ncbi:MAG: ATP-binding protein [Lachnospiraceae bacterium]|nr:ATP-binding protein [Lachnospiraceae bacterium]
MHERNHELLDVKIRQYMLPAIMMKLALQLGNIVDTILVGNLLGTEAMSAVTLSLPVLSFIQIPGYFLGNGGAIAAGILLGKRKKKEAGQVFTASFILAMIFSVIFFVASFIASAPIAGLLSGGGVLADDVESYVFVCLAGAPVLGIGLLMSSFFANDSHPQLASLYFIISNSVNLIFDYIFLKYTSLGVKGAALSTMLGFAVGFVVAVPYIRSRKRMISFTAPHITMEMIKSIVTTGMPYFTYLITTMIKMLLMNGIILSFLGEPGMAVFTVCNNTELILAMFIGGVISVIPNIAGILYGEKDYYGINVLCKKVLTYGAVLTAVLMVVVFIFTGAFVRLFGINDTELSAIMVMVLRVYVFSMPFNLLNYFGMQYYGSVQKSGLATLITTLENGVFLIPVTLVGILLGQSAGGDGFGGLALAFVMSELLTVTASFIYRRIKYPGESMLLIPDKNPGLCHDFTIHADMSEVAKVPQEVSDFCISNNIEKSKANLLAVAAEEMAANIVKHGGKQSDWIDICLTIEEDRLMLRLRDNGVPFDPTTYEYDDEEYSIHGIELAKKVAKDISYIRAIDLNNTIITV